ncbi:MAG TPA: FAD-dependent oxidoreductase [Gemmatimonadales bacterium]|nr:FAD-dependent oxidoreductase [Gemmatimonadales bacterium]
MPSSRRNDAEVDALVIGAGPAGSATAAFLARQGWRVLVADRDGFPREKACSEYMSPAAVRVLAALGVVPWLEAAGAVPLAGTDVRTAGGGRLAGRFAPSIRAPFPASGLSVPRRVLDAELVRAARGAGAVVLEHTQLGDLEREDGRVVGAALVTSEGPMRVRARLVVGADGLRSRVARSLGRRRHGRPRRVAFVAHVQDVPGLTDAAEMHVGPEGYVGLNPIGPGLANVALVVPAELAMAARGRVSAFFLERLATFAGVRGRVEGRRIAREVLVTGPFAARSTVVSAPGALLVGDAADFFDPFTGEGICSALRGAELVAATAGHALGDARRLDEALVAYRQLRRRTFAGKWAVERLIGWSMEWPALFDHAVRRIGRRRGMADTLVGVTGEIRPARHVLNPLFLARMVV